MEGKTRKRISKTQLCFESKKETTFLGGSVLIRSTQHERKKGVCSPCKIRTRMSRKEELCRDPIPPMAGRTDQVLRAAVVSDLPSFPSSLQDVSPFRPPFGPGPCTFQLTLSPLLPFRHPNTSKPIPPNACIIFFFLPSFPFLPLTQ